MKKAHKRGPLILINSRGLYKVGMLLLEKIVATNKVFD